MQRGFSYKFCKFRKWPRPGLELTTESRTESVNYVHITNHANKLQLGIKQVTDFILFLLGGVATSSRSSRMSPGPGPSSRSPTPTSSPATPPSTRTSPPSFAASGPARAPAPHHPRSGRRRAAPGAAPSGPIRDTTSSSSVGKPSWRGLTNIFACSN